MQTQLMYTCVYEFNYVLDFYRELFLMSEIPFSLRNFQQKLKIQLRLVVGHKLISQRFN